MERIINTGESKQSWIYELTKGVGIELLNKRFTLFTWCSLQLEE